MGLQYGSLIWLAFFLIAIYIAFRIYVRQRRIVNREDPRKFDFDLGQLQQMVAKGLMTQEEYLKARDVILSRSDARFEPAKGFPVLSPKDQAPPDSR